MSWSGGDWMCGACQHINFKKRDACQNCGYPKFGGPDPSTYRYNRTETLAGDWFCTGMNCGAHNYASRSSCYRCGALKDDYSSGYGGNIAGSVGYGSDCNFPPGWKTGDWICPRIGCGVHNYASRTECFKCKMPRDFGEKSLVFRTFHLFVFENIVKIFSENAIYPQFHDMLISSISGGAD